jgi:hypothetical protein
MRSVAKKRWTVRGAALQQLTPQFEVSRAAIVRQLIAQATPEDSLECWTWRRTGGYGRLRT